LRQIKHPVSMKTLKILTTGLYCILCVATCSLKAQSIITKDDKLSHVIVTKSGDLQITPAASSSMHDFDFFEGKWKIHHKKLKTRLNHSADWIEYEGTNEDFKILNGVGHTNNNKAVVDGQPAEGVGLTLFNPQTKLWSIYWASSKDGRLDHTHPVVGSFEGDIGRFYARESFNGKPILVMAQWDKSNPDKAVWSQAFSEDNGKTWEWN